MSDTDFLSDPTIPQHAATNAVMQYLYPAIAALVLTAVIIAIFRSIPKWVLLLIAAIALSVALGVKLQK